MERHPLSRRIRPPRPRARLLAAPVAAALALAVAPSAFADTTVSVENGTFGTGLSGNHVLIKDTFTVFHNEPLDTEAKIVGANVVVTDLAGDVHDGPGCTKVGSEIRCPVAGLLGVRFEGSNLNDRLTNSTPLKGVFVAANGNDMVQGGNNADQLNGGKGNDDLLGGVGGDAFRQEPGADRIDGQGSTDGISYGAATTPVAIRMHDALANDGAAGEGDRILNVENAIGSPFADAIDGSDLGNALSGGGGNDNIRGFGGNDRIDGGDGGDLMSGGLGIDSVSYATRSAGVTVRLDDAANDGSTQDASATDNVRVDVETILGGSGADDLRGPSLLATANTLTGNAGADELRGGPGNDVLSGGFGDDELFADAGLDSVDAGPDDDEVHTRDNALDPLVDCGLGSDKAEIDNGLDMAAGCEFLAL